jgi:hypothetical protein
MFPPIEADFGRPPNLLEGYAVGLSFEGGRVR